LVPRLELDLDVRMGLDPILGFTILAAAVLVAGDCAGASDCRCRFPPSSVDAIDGGRPVRW
jgi:uncharacterized membrane protein